MTAAPQILVVDDSAANRALAEATLVDEGYRVVLAESGAEGLRLFEQHRPDCVLLDVRMPGMDGFEVCKRLRALEAGRDTPILFLTALRDVDSFDGALRAGGDDFLTKPVRPTELALRVQAALKLGRMGADLREHVQVVRRQRDELMRLGLQKEQLAQFVVHDLKNPVATMDLHAQVLLRDPSLSDAARASAQHIREEARTLIRLLLNLLDIGKSDEGGLEVRRASLDLAAIASDVMGSFAASAEAEGVVLECDIHAPTVSADADLLRRVLDNLVENALRHSPTGGKVVLSTLTMGDAVDVCVSDQGRGIEPDKRERVFERFFQLEGGAMQVRTGRGLGLSFCKLAVEAHGGTIRVEDRAPGTAFCFRIPHGA